MRTIFDIQTGEVTQAEDSPVTPPTAEELAAEAARLADLADRDSARQFARLAALKVMSPAGVQTYITNRYPLPAGNLAEANSILVKMKDDLETLAIGMAILARRL